MALKTLKIQLKASFEMKVSFPYRGEYKSDISDPLAVVQTYAAHRTWIYKHLNV